MNWYLIVLVLSNVNVLSADKPVTLSNGCVFSRPSTEELTTLGTYFPRLECSNLGLTAFDPTGVPDDVVEIILSFNQLTSIKLDDFANLTKVGALDLSHNNITELVPSFHKNPTAKMAACNTLDISYNKLTKIPTDAFRDIPNLFLLDISGNQIEILGDRDFETLSKLTFLTLGSNPFVKISTIAWKNLTSTLRLLHMGFSKLTTVPSFVSDMTKAISVGLPGNAISDIQANAFSKAKSLETLDLSSNKIRRLDPDAFNGADSLTTIDLTDNQLETLPSGVFDTMNGRRNVAINLYENPIRCDCKIAWLKRWKNTMEDEVRYKCMQPKRHHGKRAFELQIDDFTCTPNDVEWSETCDNVSTTILPQPSSRDSENKICPEKCKCFDSRGVQYYPISATKPNQNRKLRRLWRREDIIYPHVDCSETGITKIPDNIRTDVNTLTLADNKIKTLNLRDLEKFPSLQALDLEGCGLSNIVLNTSVVLKRLVSLSVNHNNLELFGSAHLQSFPNLIALRIHNNRLTTIPNDIFKHNRNLHHIDIGPNPVKNFDHKCLDGLDIYSLSLRKMNLTEIPKIKSKGMTYLEISDNKINSIPNNTFADMPILFRLTLDNNLISDVGALAFNGTAKLRYLDLSENRLTTLPIGVFDDLEQYRINIELWRNRIHCDCRLKWLKQWIEGLEISDPMTEIRFTCFKPWRLHGTISDALPSENFTCEEEDDTDRRGRGTVGTEDAAANGRRFTLRQMAIAVVITILIIAVVLFIIKCISMRVKARKQSEYSEEMILQ